MKLSCISICFKVIVLFALNAEFTSASTYFPKLVSQIKINKPGFVCFVPSLSQGVYHIAISSFNGAPFSPDHVYYLSNYTLNDTTVRVTPLDNTNVEWPNELSYVGSSIFTNKIDPYGGVVVPGGFLVPSKENGGIFYYPFTSKDRSKVSTDKPIEITETPQGKLKWFYHRAKFVDVSGDGLNDILTCRTYKPTVGQTKVELVAFIFDDQSLTYVEKVILNDVCDVFFDVADIDNDGKIEIIAAGFFISQLNLVYSDDPKNSFINGNVKTKSIDTTGGKFFDVKIVDLDKEGNLELLVTNHQGNKDSPKGAIYYYQLNGNVRKGDWTRYTVYNDFPVLKKGLNQAAPGAAKAFQPNLKDENSRPYLLVSGDGSEKAYLFQPSDTNPLTYTLVWSKLFSDTVGGSSIADINDDGISEFVVANYENNNIDVYTFQLSRPRRIDDIN